MLLHGCKWDPQVGDVSTLATFPLILSAGAWRELSADAEALAAELLAVEQALLGRPDLIARLGLPRRLRRVFVGLAAGRPATPEAARIVRFDFHPTPAGWRVSECNADVPGGFTEASTFPALMTERFVGGGGVVRPVGDVTAAWVDALVAGATAACDRHPPLSKCHPNDGAAASCSAPLRVALLAATGYLEDQQIVALLARAFRARGHWAWPADPRLVDASGPVAHLRSAAYDGPVDLVVRFYQGEWLARLPRRHWRGLLTGGRTPVANGPASLLGESKRLPLLWDELGVPLPTWRRLLPENRDPRDARWRTDAGWLLKGAYANNGDAVLQRDLAAAPAWRRAAWVARLRPGRWVAQRRFESVPVETPDGPMHACVGVHVVNGQACGAYARLSPHRVIDYRAVDVALLADASTDQEPPA